jgi:Spy/CpxP family protein refolding chaperone
MMKRLLRLALVLASLAPMIVRADPTTLPAPPGPPGLFMHVEMGPPPFGGPPFGDDPAMMLPVLLQGVGLSDDQKKQVREILKVNHQTLFTNFEQLRTANQALADKLVATGPVSEGDLQPLVDQVMRVRQGIMTQGLKVVLQVRALLTPEQLARAAEVKAKMNDLRKQMRDLLGEPQVFQLGDAD